MQTMNRTTAVVSISSLICDLVSSAMGVSSTVKAELSPNLASNPRFPVLIRVPKPAHSLHKFAPVLCTAAPVMVSVRKHAVV